MSSYEAMQKKLQKYYDEIMSDEDLGDPFADCGSSDEYKPSDSDGSDSSSQEILAKRAKVEDLEKKTNSKITKTAEGIPIAGPSGVSHTMTSDDQGVSQILPDQVSFLYNI
jgi:hypothetical protein